MLANYVVFPIENREMFFFDPEKMTLSLLIVRIHDLLLN